MFKKIFITLFLLIVLAFGGLSYYVSTIDWNRYKSKITDQIEQITGKKVLIGGTIDLKFWPTPHLSATNIKIYNPSSGSSGTIAEVEEMVTDLSLMPLLHKRFEINNMNLLNAKVSVEFLSNGKTNWHSETIGEQSFNLSSVDIAFNSITLQNSVVHILNPTLNLDLVLQKLNADISAQSLSGPFRIDGNFVKDDTPAVFALYVGTLSESFATSMNLVLTHPSSDSQASFDGSILANNSEIQGNFTIESKRPSTFLNTIAGQVLLPEKYNYPLDATVELLVNPEQINLSSFIIKYGNDLAGSGKVLIPLKEKIDERKKVEIAFEMTDFDVMPFVASATEYLKKLDNNQKNYEPNFEYDVVADITSTRAHYNDEIIREFKLNADFINNVLQIKNLSGILPGETDVAFKGDVFSKEKIFSYDLKIQALSQDFLKFLEFIGHKPNVYAQSTYRTARASMEMSGTLNQIKLAVGSFSLDKTELSGILGMKRGRRNAFFAAVQSESINFDNYMPPLTDEEKKLPPFEQAKILLNKFKFLNDVDMHAELALKLGIYNKVPFENTVLNFDSEGGIINLKKFELGQIGNAAFALEGKIKNLGINPSLENAQYKISTPDFNAFKNKLRINLPDWPLFNLSKNFESEGIISGTLNNANIRSSAKLDKTNLAYQGRLFTQEDELYFRGNLDVKTPDFVDFVNRLNIDYNPSNLGISAFTFKADVEGKISKWRAININSFVGIDNFTGSFSYQKPDNLPKIKANIEANMFEFDRFIFAPKRKSAPKVSKEKNQFLNKPSWDSTPMNYEPFKKFDLSGKFSIKNLSYLNDDIENVQFWVDIKDNTIDVKNFTATKNSAPIKADLNIALTEKPFMKGSFEISEYPIENFGGTTYNIESGTLKLKTTFNGSASSELDFIKSGIMDISFDVSKPVFRGFDINLIETDLKDRTRSDNLETLLRTALSSGKTKFNIIGGDLHIENMKYSLNNALMSTDTATIDMNAEGLIEAWSTNAAFQLTLDKLKEKIEPITYLWEKSLSNPVLIVNSDALKNKYDTYWAQIEEEKNKKERLRIETLTNNMNKAQETVKNQIQIIESEILLRVKNYRPKSFDARPDSVYESVVLEANRILKNLKTMAEKAHKKYDQNDIDDILLQTEVLEPLLSDLIRQADNNYIFDMKLHIDSAFNQIQSIYDNSVEKSKNYQNTLNSYTMRLMQLGSLVTLNDLDEVKKNRQIIESSIKEIDDIYRLAQKAKQLSDGEEEKVSLVDKAKTQILDYESRAKKLLNTLNNALEELFEYIQDVVYFEQTGTHRRAVKTQKDKDTVQPQSEAPKKEITSSQKEVISSQKPLQTTIMREEEKIQEKQEKNQTTLPQKTEQQNQKALVSVPQVQQTTPVTKPTIETPAETKLPTQPITFEQPKQPEKVNQPEQPKQLEQPQNLDQTPITPVQENLPKKFSTQEIIQETPVLQTIDISPKKTETVTIIESVTKPEVIIEEPEEPKMPLLIEVQDDYASKPAISGNIIRKKAKVQKPTTDNTYTPLLKPLTTEVAPQGVVKRK